MFTNAIVRPPAPNFAEGLTTAGLGAPDFKLALKQHDAYCAALEECGLTLIRLEADERYPDSCFVEDATVVFRSSAGKADADVRAPSPQVVLTRPGAPSRAGEVESMRAVLKQLLPDDAIQQIEAPGTLDGGDVCEAGKHFFIGLSARTNEPGAAQLANFVAAHGYTTSFVDIRELARPLPQAVLTSLLHLKSGIADLGDRRLVVTESLAEHKEFVEFDLVRVRRGEEYATNCVKVNDFVLVAAGHNHFQETLRELGYQTIVLDMSEFQKMDGGLSCLSLRW